jgi:hypothetical protein
MQNYRKCPAMDELVKKNVVCKHNGILSNLLKEGNLAI